LPQDASDHDRESRRILDRVGRETDPRGEPPGQTADADWPEIWGRRIARLLIGVMAVVLIIWLLQFLTQAG
jgi:hypothetical protein